MNRTSEPHFRPQPSGPIHSIATCPVCGAGLCGIRICAGDDPTEARPKGGFVMCDECEAVWMEPDIDSGHIYVDPASPKCPVCHGGLWTTSRWAVGDEVEMLGWTSAIDPQLDAQG